MDIWVIYSILFLWTFVYMSPGTCAHPFFWGMYLGIELLVNRTWKYSAQQDCAKMYFKLGNNLYTFQQFISSPVDLHPNQYLILSHLLIFVILVNIRWYLIVCYINIFPLTNVIEHLFMFTGYPCFFFWEMTINIFCPFLRLLFSSFLLICRNCLITWILIICQLHVLNIFPLWLVFFLYGVFAWEDFPNFNWLEINLFSVDSTFCVLSSLTYGLKDILYFLLIKVEKFASHM